jgi:hypothetical protein
VSRPLPRRIIFEKTHFSACEEAERGLPRSGDVASRFSAFIDGLMSVIGHAARAKPLRDYCTGLMMLAIARALSRWRR